MKLSRSALAICLAALLGACGGPDPAPAEPAPAPAPEAAPAEAEAAPTEPEAAATEAAPAEKAHHGEHAHDFHHHGDDKKPIGHTFDDASKYVKHFEGAERDAWQKPDHVVSLLALQPGMTVADIGAGTGYFLPRLSAAVGAGGAVLGIDISQSMVDHMKARAAREKLANVRALLARTDDPGLAAGSVDRVLIVNTWHHIPERGAYAARLHKALRAGGAVYIVDFTMDSPHGPPKHHRLRAEAVMKELEAGGLRAELVTEKLPHQYVVRGTRR